MKKLCLLVLIGLLILTCACTGATNSYNPEDPHTFIKQLSEARSIEFERTSYSEYESEEGARSTTWNSETKYIKSPLAQWGCMIRTSEPEYDGNVPIETFIEEKDDKLFFSVKGYIDDSEEIKWGEPSTSTGDQKELMKQGYERQFSQLEYLLEKNVDSFQGSPDILGDVKCIRYDGHITQESVLDFYEETGRDFYVRGGMLEEKENLSREDLKNELTTSEAAMYGISVGFNQLVFTETPAPVSIWVNSKTGYLVKIKIDFTEAEAGLLETLYPEYSLVVTDKFEEYNYKAFNSLKKLKRPE